MGDERCIGRSDRKRMVEESLHSVRSTWIEGTAQTLADAEDYIAGRITLEDWGRRARRRHGVPEP